MRKIIILFTVIIPMIFATEYPASIGWDVNGKILPITFVETKEGLNIVIKDGVKSMKTNYGDPKTNKTFAPWNGKVHNTFDVSIHYGDPVYGVRTFYPSEYKIKIVGNDCVLSFPELEKYVMIKFQNLDWSNTPVTIKMTLDDKLIIKVDNIDILGDYP